MCLSQWSRTHTHEKTTKNRYTNGHIHAQYRHNLIPTDNHTDTPHTGPCNPNLSGLCFLLDQTNLERMSVCVCVCVIFQFGSKGSPKDNEKTMIILCCFYQFAGHVVLKSFFVLCDVVTLLLFLKCTTVWCGGKNYYKKNSEKKWKSESAFDWFNWRKILKLIWLR